MEGDSDRTAGAVLDGGLGGNTPHPAKYSAPVLEQITRILHDWATPGDVLDPFAGVGTLQRIVTDFPANVWCVELEPEWAKQAPSQHRVICDDALKVMEHFARRGESGMQLNGVWWPTRFDAVVTSPTYGNRMADKHTPGPGDTSRRHTYRHYLGRMLHPRNSGGLQWGRKYREFHRHAWELVHVMLKPEGVFVLNVSDHIRKGEIVPVTLWHKAVCKTVGFELLDEIKVETPRMRHGENANLRVDHETILAFRK